MDFVKAITELTDRLDTQEKAERAWQYDPSASQMARNAEKTTTETLQHVLDDFNKLPKEKRQEIMGELQYQHRKALAHLKVIDKTEDGRSDFALAPLEIPPLFDESGKQIEKK